MRYSVLAFTCIAVMILGLPSAQAQKDATGDQCRATIPKESKDGKVTLQVVSDMTISKTVGTAKNATWSAFGQCHCLDMDGPMNHGQASVALVSCPPGVISPGQPHTNMIGSDMCFDFNGVQAAQSMDLVCGSPPGTYPVFSDSNGVVVLSRHDTACRADSTCFQPAQTVPIGTYSFFDGTPYNCAYSNAWMCTKPPIRKLPVKLEAK